MPKSNMRVWLPTLDRDRYIRDLRAAMLDGFIRGAQKFLQAAIPRVPVFTGMASGGFDNLETLAGIYVPRAPVRATRNYYYYPGRLIRSPDLGRSMSSPSTDILSGDLTTTQTGTRIYFNFSININYFDIVDQKWGSFDAGSKAFDDELDKLVLPDINKYFVRRQIL